MITENKKIKIYNKNLFEKNDKLNNILEVSLKNLIEIKCYSIDFYQLQEIIDSAIYFYKNYDKFKHLLKKKQIKRNRFVDVLSYFNSELILRTPEKMPVIKSLINISRKKKSLLKIFYRITNNNFVLLYKIINNKETILQHISKHIKEKNNEKILFTTIKVNTETDITNNNNNDNTDDADDTDDIDITDDADDTDDIDDTDDADDTDDIDITDDADDADDIDITDDADDADDADDIKNNSKFYDIKNILNQNLKKVDRIKSKGWQSSIGFFVLENNMKNKIQNKIKINIDNCIVKKNFIKVDEKVTLHFNGLEGQYNREIKGLLSVYKKKHFPILLSKNEKEKYIIMSYCGVPLTENNIPKNWKDQLNTIINTLKESKCSNNDMWENNFLIKDDIIHLVDFGWSTINESYPYINITEDDINNFNNIFTLLDKTTERVIERRILFRESL